jgi:HEAT repeat protein
MTQIINFSENQLKKRLARLPIEKLLIEMTNNNYYFPYNIWKKLFDKNSIESGKWISWFATRQAEKIIDRKEGDRLIEIIKNTNSKKEIRRKAYFCLGHLSKNLSDKEIFDFLINKLNSESEEIQETILIALTNANKPLEYNLIPIINILKNGKIGLKTSAAIALKNSKNPEIEIELLKSFEKEKNKHLQEMIAATLRTVGTDKSIPILENKLKTAKGKRL